MDTSERNKAIELIKEMRGGGECSENQLTWMYKIPSDLVDKEEYLLGKAIGKSFNADGNIDNGDLIGRSYEPSNIPKRLLSKPESTEQVDIAKKIHEDPLYAIKQKELEARRKLLDNPVKLKELQKMIMERNLLKHQQKQQKKKKYKKNAMKDEKYLDKLILKKLKILSENQREKLLEEAAEDSDSSSSTRKITKKRRQNKSYNGKGSSDDKKEKKRKIAESRHKESIFSVENNRGLTQGSRRGDITSKNNKKFMENKIKKEISKLRAPKNNNSMSSRIRRSSSKSKSSTSSCSPDSSSSGSSSSDAGDSKKRTKNKRIKVKSQTQSGKSSDRNKKLEKYISLEKEEHNIRKMKRHYSKSGSSSNDSEYGTREKNRREMRDWTRTRNFTHGQISKHERNITEKHQASSYSKKISEKERQFALKEMMENAKVKKVEREQNLADHRRIQAEEEGLKDYDDGFMRRQISQATSQGTVADRIRSNVNNIQRSRVDMERSFVRK